MGDTFISSRIFLIGNRFLTTLCNISPEILFRWIHSRQRCFLVICFRELVGVHHGGVALDISVNGILTLSVFAAYRIGCLCFHHKKYLRQFPKIAGRFSEEDYETRELFNSSLGAFFCKFLLWLYWFERAHCLGIEMHDSAPSFVILCWTWDIPTALEAIFEHFSSWASDKNETLFFRSKLSLFAPVHCCCL